MNQSNRFNTITSTVTQSLVLVYQVLAAVVFIVSLFSAYGWLKNPFIGGFFEQTMVLNESVTREPGQEWALQAEGFKLGDQLVSVAGRPISNSSDLLAVLETLRVSQTVPVVMHLRDGGTRQVNVTLQALAPIDQLSYFAIPAFLSLVFLLISLWIFGLRRTEPAGRAFSVFTTSMAIVIGALFDLYTSHYFTYLWTMAVALSGGALISLTLVFPQEARILFRAPYLRWVGYAASFLLAFNAYRVLYDFNHPTAYVTAWGYIYTFVGLAGLFYFGVLGYRAFFSLSPVVKSQARTILIGALLAFTPIVIWLLYTSLRDKGLSGEATPFNPYLFLFFIFFPLANGYVILRFRLLRTDYWLRKGMVYSLLTVFVISAYGLLVSGLSLLLSTRVSSNSPFLIGGLVFLIAVFLDPLRNWLQAMIDSIFFRGQRAYEDRLRAFSHGLTNAYDLHNIGQVLREQVSSSLVPEQFHVYTYDSLNDQYAALSNGSGRPTSDIRFQSSSPLVQYFQKETIPLYLDTINPPALLKGDESRLSLLGARLYVGLPGEDRPVGWLALGSPRSGKGVYTPRDLNFLENLADQASVAIARVQTVADLERRVQEMNALTRVSQGVNVTLTFDDVLELIYAQATQILPSSLFHITLYNKAANYFYYAFRVDDNERMTSRENQPLPATLGLGAEIIRRGRPMLTQEYVRECQAHNLIPSAMDVYAWMGVPLNSGSETIGALSIGSRDPIVSYTRAQLNLLQAIADQTVGAIVKARLLQETQQRAYQLSTLNEITRQLTSTLDQEPLLRNILEYAVNILNCEAGTLFLMDEQTGDLIFRVTAGPVATNLLGQRLQAGVGVAGRAVQTRAPVIENDSQRSTATRFDGTDKQTGYTSKSLLAVPMQIKDRVLGVIEVINRKDGLPFVEDDQNLLTAFAGQAAVAIENARLLAMTDQELTRSVEELQVMGRIVRELNASLDVDRAMRITLEYAMRHSNAEAGLIGMLEEDELRIMAQQGYEEVISEQTAHLPLQYPAIQSVIQTGQASQISLLGNGTRGIMNSAHSQIIIPIRREAQVIGLILLESTSDSQGNLAFLNRLSDNAAIAISNAQLYAEVQRANLAKSEFVSFVAHELKNPMTSIKGYTELLAAGSVGPINEMQSNFLGTIRSNVERMSTLVSDLNDNAKIEAGRLRLDYRPVEVKEVVDEVIRSTRRQVEDKRQTVDVQLPSQLPQVWADRTRVAQVLINLVSNAHKYTPEGGVIFIGAEATDNQWDPEGARRVAHLWVQDNGIGISFEDQARIFQRFFRSEDTRAREAPGTGLGLNITKSLVEMQGGRIWFNSEFRKGTTFHFTIPISEG